ncbi:hypothetical protein ABW20_dc0103662 [Dactylellina cionopaga]|nr:hypothetical protein ABW20_dc0103662 [Dactylellina cionopaga]
MGPVEINREWKEIGRKIVEVLLLLFDKRAVRVVIRDEKGSKKATFALDEVEGEEEEGVKDRWARILEQAGYAKTPWENVEAAWNGITMRGIMGLTPLVDTERQYICMASRLANFDQITNPHQSLKWYSDLEERELAPLREDQQSLCRFIVWNDRVGEYAPRRWEAFGCEEGCGEAPIIYYICNNKHKWG